MALFWSSGAKKKVLDRTTIEILNLEKQKKGLETEIEQIRLKLDNEREGQRMELERAKHRFTLGIDAAKQDLQRQRDLFEEDRTRALKAQSDLHSAEIEKLRKESDIKLMELTSLAKLNAEQKVAEATLAKDKAVQVLETKYAKELSALESSLAKDYYDKMQDALADMHKNGTEMSRFAQDMAMKFVDKGLEKPMPAHTINETRLIGVEQK
jgi:hypothetical protein